MNLHTLFSDNSEIYQRARPNYPDSLFTYITNMCNQHEAAWDCACGSGQASIALARYFKKVEATDVSKEQINNAVLLDNIRYQVCAAETTPFSQSSFDLVTVAQALHWFDYSLFWPEVKRVMKKDGVFAAWGYNWPLWDMDLEPVIQKYFLDIIMPYFPSNNQLLWNHYRDIDFPFKQVNHSSFDMSINVSLNQLFDLFHSFSATKLCIEDIGTDFFEEAYNQIKKVWRDPKTVRSFKMDTVCVVAY